MPRLDRVIDFMVKQQGTKFSMKNDESCYLFTPKGSRPLNQVLTLKEIEQIVEEVLPTELKNQFSENCYLEFPFKSAKGYYALQVERDPEGLQVTLMIAEGEVSIVAEPHRTVVEEEPVAEPEIVPELKPAEPERVPTRETTPEKATVTAEPERVEKVAPEAVDLAAPRIARLPGQYLENLFRYMLKNGATDLHLSAGTKPFVRIDGRLQRLDQFDALRHEPLQEILWQIVPEDSREEFYKVGQSDFSQDAGEQVRLRCNVYRDNEGIGAVIRLVPRLIKPYDELGIPKVVTDLCRKRQGLILVTGAAGSGKSTTIAALIDFINRERECHILTLENPIEFVHRSQKSLVNQRQIGLHVNSLPQALEAAAREDPDVCMVDDLSDASTIQSALQLALRGRLVFGSLFTKTTGEAVQYLLDQFPEDQKATITATLSTILLGIVSQSLCRKAQGGQVAAFEVLLGTPSVRDVIRSGRIEDLPSALRAGRKDQMVSLNTSLAQLAQNHTITLAEAYEKSIDKNLLLELFGEMGVKFDPAAVPE